MADQSIHPAIPPGAETLELFLDDRKVVARKGESIINVAARENTYIPHYCWHPALSVAGNCRLCLVEVHSPNPKEPGQWMKNPKPVIACQTPVSPNMKVFTKSELARSCQNGMMEFLLVNHPLDCPICDRGGECMLQRYSMEYGQGHTRFHDQKRKFHKPQFDPLIDIERNRCIMCTRCVRFCDEVAGEHVMGVFDRGEGNYIGTFGLGPVSNIFSGNVIDLCPVGCLTSKPFRFRARVWELKQTQSTSVWDASGAKVTHWTRNGRLYRTTPPSRKYHGTYTVNEDTEEFIDNLTRFGSDFWRSASRWDETRIRIGSSLMPASRVEAIRQTASALAQARVSGGHTAVLVGARATMEEAYLAGKFARTVLGTDSIDWRTMLRTRESAAAVDFALQFADGDMADMFDALLIANGDFQYTVPTFAMRVKEWARINRLPIVMVGHKHDRYFAPHATVRLAVPPGSTAHALVMLKKIVASGPEDFRVAELAKLANTTEAEVKKAVAILSAAKKGLLLQSLEDCNGIFLEDEVPAAVALRQALPGFRYLPTLHDRNAYGHAAVGAQPGRLPADRVRTAQVWRHEAAMPANGVGAQDLLAAIESGKVTHLVVFGAEALHAYGDEGRVLAALSRLQFFALTDMFESPYAHKAHVFFAAPSNLERDGTYMDVQGNLARLAMAEQPVGGATPDWETISAIAKAMGSTGFGYRSIAEVFDEMMSLLAPDFAGSFDGLLLPGPDNDVSVRDPGGARRWTPEYNPGDFRTDGAHFRKTGPAIELSGEVDQVHPLPEGEGFVLTWGEHVQGDDYYLAFASAAKLLRTPPHVEFHAQDAADLGIEENAPVRLTLADGRSWEAAARVRIGGPTRGCLWVPAGVGPVNLRGMRALPRVTVELLPQAQPAEQELAGAVR